MAQPTPYVPTTDFSDEELNSVAGRSTVRTAPLDAEFSNLQTTLDEVLANLAVIQRDDTKLSDGIVETHTLSSSVAALMGQWDVKGSWATSTAYTVRDVVIESGYTYVCAVNHTSGVFATDLASEYWLLLSGISPSTVSAFWLGVLTQVDAADSFTAMGVTAYVQGLFSATDAATARATLGAQALDNTLTAIAGVTVAADQVIYATGPDAFAATSLTALGRTFLATSTTATARAAIDAQQLSTNLTALAGLSLTADQLPYATGAGALALTPLTAFARTLLDDADAATARTTLDAQQLDATLTALAAVVTAADKMIYATGVDTFATADLTSSARTFLADSEADNRTAKARVNFNGTGTITIRDSVNVSSLTDHGTGDHSVTYSSSMADTNHSVGGSAGGQVSTDALWDRVMSPYNLSTTAVRIRTTASAALVDVTHVSVIVM